MLILNIWPETEASHSRSVPKAFGSAGRPRSYAREEVSAMHMKPLRVGEVFVLRYDSAAVQENGRSEQKRRESWK